MWVHVANNTHISIPWLLAKICAMRMHITANYLCEYINSGVDQSRACAEKVCFRHTKSCKRCIFLLDAVA